MLYRHCCAMYPRDVQEVEHMDKRRSESIEALTISPQEAANMAGVCARTIRRACERGEIPAAKIGRKWLINREKFTQLFDGTAAIMG